MPPPPPAVPPCLQAGSGRIQQDTVVALPHHGTRLRYGHGSPTRLPWSPQAPSETPQVSCHPQAPQGNHSPPAPEGHPGNTRGLPAAPWDGLGTPWGGDPQAWGTTAPHGLGTPGWVSLGWRPLGQACDTVGCQELFWGTTDGYHRLSSVKKLGEWWGTVWGCWEGTRDCLGVPWGFAHIGGYQGNCLGGA